MSDQHFDALPKVHTTYANIVKSLLPIGDHAKVSKEQLPKATYRVDNLVIDQGNLQDYRKICGFKDDGYVPATYFAVLSQALQMNMMVKEPFPFALLGLVHVENSVTQYRPIADNQAVALAVQFANLRDHDKGQQFDFVTTVHQNDELVWTGTSTYLSRTRKKGKLPRKSPKESIEKLAQNVEGTHSIFAVPEDIGRRYAFVSGDFNLIHLHPLSARAFGFPKAIAHGMWSKAKCIAELGELPESYAIEVSFKLPILLPTEVELIAEPISVHGDNVHSETFAQFGLYSAKNGRPHLLGQFYSPAVLAAPTSDAGSKSAET